MNCSFIFFTISTTTTEIYTLSLHDALPISGARGAPARRPVPSQRLRRLRRPRTRGAASPRSEEHRLNSSHSQSSYAVFCLKKKMPTLREPYVDKLGEQGVGFLVLGGGTNVS